MDTNSQKVKLNNEQCLKISAIIENIKFKKDYYNREYLNLSTNNETKFRVYLYSVAICHQTHSLINKKLNLKGWDYLEYTFSNLSKNNSNLLDPEYLNSITIRELSKQLKPLFADDNNPDNCTLDRLEERADFIKQISEILIKKYNGSVINLINLCDSFLINGSNGLYRLLEDFSAYSDEFKKKSTAFIKFLEEAKLLTIKDPENFIPIVDYHAQRVMLRMGCVEIIDNELKQKLFNKKEIDVDTEIRSNVINAIKIISKNAGYSIPKIDDFFWSLGRSCCKENILCRDKKCNKNPCTFNAIMELGPSHMQCIFNKICKGSIFDDYKQYWQPIVKTSFY